jgi:hypothetical protein
LKHPCKIRETIPNQGVVALAPLHHKARYAGVEVYFQIHAKLYQTCKPERAFRTQGQRDPTRRGVYPPRIL